MVRNMMTMAMAVLVGACSPELAGEYEVTDIYADTCGIQAELGDTVQLVPSCEARRLDDPSIECNAGQPDFFLRVDSLSEGNGRKTTCDLPAEDGTFVCATQRNEGKNLTWTGIYDSEAATVDLLFTERTEAATCTLHMGAEWTGDGDQPIPLVAFLLAGAGN